MRDIEDLIEKLHPRLPGHIKCFMYELVVRERLRCAEVAEALIGTHSAEAIPKVIREGLDLSMEA